MEGQKPDRFCISYLKESSGISDAAWSLCELQLTIFLKELVFDALDICFHQNDQFLKVEHFSQSTVGPAVETNLYFKHRIIFRTITGRSNDKNVEKSKKLLKDSYPPFFLYPEISMWTVSRLILKLEADSSSHVIKTMLENSESGQIQWMLVQLLPHRLIAKIVTALIADQTVNRDITAIDVMRNLLNLARVKSFVLDKSLITSPSPSETFIIRSNKKTKFQKTCTAAKPSQKRKFVENQESNNDLLGTKKKIVSHD